MTKNFPRAATKRTEPQWRQLNKVIDPELGIGLVDLGLIYDIKIKDAEAHIIMTLTSPGCPVGPMILQDVESAILLHNPEISKVNVELVWDPVWTHERMDQDLRDMMFGI